MNQEAVRISMTVSALFGSEYWGAPWPDAGLVGPLPIGWAGGDCSPLLGLWTVSHTGARCEKDT